MRHIEERLSDFPVYWSQHTLATPSVYRHHVTNPRRDVDFFRVPDSKLLLVLGAEM
jgi:hypothetical protein